MEEKAVSPEPVEEVLDLLDVVQPAEAPRAEVDEIIELSLDDIAAPAESGEELRIFAAGGEGTAFEVLNGVVGFDNVSIGVIPCGSANDFLKYFGNKEEFFDIAKES